MEGEAAARSLGGLGNPLWVWTEALRCRGEEWGEEMENEVERGKG